MTEQRPVTTTAWARRARFKTRGAPAPIRSVSLVLQLSGRTAGRDQLGHACPLTAAVNPTPRASR